MQPQLKLTRTSSKLADRQMMVENALVAQRKKESIQSVVVAAVVVALIGAILALIAILPSFRETQVIVSYTPKVIKEEVPDRPADLAKGMKPKPASSSSAMARVIAANVSAPVAVPVPEKVDPTRPFGMDDDFNAGFGAGDGDGDGGGGSSFFGTKRNGKRVVYIVDFSLSMESDCPGGTRIALLKKELINSINALPESMNFNIIYFSHHAWTDETPGPNQADQGWNGLGTVPIVPWKPASKEGKSESIAKVNSTSAHALGHLMIALSLVLARSAFFLGLVFIVIGTGLLKPNISAIVGELYPGGGSRRDAGFSIFYMGINLGALLGPLVTGYLGEKVGWHYGFGAAGIGMIIGLITFRVREAALAGHGAEPTGSAEEKRKGWWVISGLVVTIALVTGLAMAGLLPIHPVAVAEHMTGVIVAMALVYFGYLFFLGGLSGADRKRVVVILILFIFSAIFWAGFEQAPTSLNLFARDYTDRVILGWQMPTLWLQSVNSLFVILLAPVFAWGWIWLSRHGGDLSSPAKFSLGLLLAGLGFLLMVVPATMILRAGGVLKVSVWWLTASYLLQSAGELALSPVGLSSMTKLAPRAFAGQMMGVWFMATALGNLIAGLVGGKVNPEQLEQMPALFKQTTFSLLIAAVILALLIRPIRSMMREKPAG